MKTLYETMTDEGRKYHSEYVTHALGAEERDRFKESIFPLGGHPGSSGPIPWKRKFYESYHFSDPKKSGR